MMNQDQRDHERDFQLLVDRLDELARQVHKVKTRFFWFGCLSGVVGSYVGYLIAHA